MKRILAICIMLVIPLVMSSCGEKVTIEGTWYSVTDARMYNFKDGEITLSGAVVGQYEDNGDSTVISMLADETNKELFITTVNKVDVLADTISGEGTVYFCKSLENAETFVAQKEEQEEYERKREAIEPFLEYINYGLLGTWIPEEEGSSSYDKVEFKADGVVVLSVEKTGEIYNMKGIKDEEGYVKTDMDAVKDSDGRYIPRVTMYLSEPGEDEDVILLNLVRTDNTYSEDFVQIDGDIFKKIQ